jgi:hypothetical protein
VKTRENSADDSFALRVISLFENFSEELAGVPFPLNCEETLIITYIHAHPGSENQKNIEKAFLLICSHPEYLFLKPEKYRYSPFHNIPNKNIFNLFYFHEDTSDEDRKIAVNILLKNKKFADDVSLGHAQAFHMQKMILFYLEMMGHNLIPRELLLAMLAFLIASAQQDILISLQTDHKLPSLYSSSNHTLALYQQKSFSLEWLIKRAKVGVENYIQDTPSKKGQTRRICMGHILSNQSLSSEFKIMAIHAILHESTWETSRIQIRITAAMGRHLAAFNAEAEKCAKSKDIRLSTFSKKLLAKIYDEEFIGKIYVFKTETEESILETMGITKKTSNTKKI